MSAIQQVLAAGGSLPPTPPGQVLYTSAGTWVCPPGVTRVSVVCVGGGGTRGSSAGAGGELRYKNNITVTPGASYTVSCVPELSYAGYDGYDSYFIDTSTCLANGGQNGYNTPPLGGSGGVGDGGGNGGQGAGGGGGAGGYSGNGGNGSNTVGGAGGGGAGGGGASDGSGNFLSGGGVGLSGEGASGAASDFFGPGKPGSGGAGASYGGGGGTYTNNGGGAVRIIWPGDVRQFPSTRTADE